MIQLDDIEKEQLRHTVMAVLAARHPTAVTRKAVLTHAAMDVGFNLDLANVVCALEFLTQLGHVQKVNDDFGATEYWQATASGILAIERSKRPGSRSHD